MFSQKNGQLMLCFCQKLTLCLFQNSQISLDCFKFQVQPQKRLEGPPKSYRSKQVMNLGQFIWTEYGRIAPSLRCPSLNYLEKAKESIKTLTFSDFEWTLFPVFVGKLSSIGKRSFRSTSSLGWECVPGCHRPNQKAVTKRGCHPGILGPVFPTLRCREILVKSDQHHHDISDIASAKH